MLFAPVGWVLTIFVILFTGFDDLTRFWWVLMNVALDNYVGGMMNEDWRTEKLER